MREKMSSGLPGKTLTIIVPALNEEGKIADTVTTILPLAHDLLDDFEIVLVDDGSTDTTGAIMDQFEASDPHISVIHHPSRRGLGVALREVLATAKFDSIVLIPGDDAYRSDGIAKMLKAMGAADLVVCYRDNQSDRSLTRSIQSHTLRFILNFLFGFGLVDYHGIVVYPVKWLRRISIKADGYGFQICALVSLLQLGLTHVQAPVSLNAELKGSSRALRPRTYLELGVTVLSLLRRLPIRNIDASEISARSRQVTR
jgi:glycosyltransferase involved in cell wall biosynthesis